MTEASAWIIWIVMMPLLAATLSFVAGRQVGALLAPITAAGVGLSLVGLTRQILLVGPVRYTLGGWGAPLGIELYADGLSVFMLIMTGVVGSGITLYALAYFHSEPAAASEVQAGDRASTSFWPLWLFAWGALNALFLSGDIFNLYVTLELLTLSAVALIGLARQQAALAAALRYLLAALVGSLFYLLGVALIYSAYGTVNSRSLGAVVEALPVTWWSAALMTLGLTMKTALFPMHFWLPPAHGNAPAPVSALLSALMIKAPFYVVLRLWFSVFARVITSEAGVLLGGLGAAAIVWGSVQALRQQRLKLLVAYSTVAQVGYLFLGFALIGEPALVSQAWSGATYYALAHACAKASMFLAVGAIMRALGHDHLHGLNGIGQRLPMSVFAFGLAGVSLMGLPPSGGFVGKWMLLNAALQGGQWWVATVILIGSLLAATYIFPVLARAMATDNPPSDPQPVPRTMQVAAMALAMVAAVLGLVAKLPLEVLEIGSPFSGFLSQEPAP